MLPSQVSSLPPLAEETEAALMEAVWKLLTDWFPQFLFCHFPDSRRMKGIRGIPDLLILGVRGALFAELKGPRTRITMDQLKWRNALLQAGENWVCWRPEDYPHNIVRALTALS